MAKFELTLTIEVWINKGLEPAERSLKDALGKLRPELEDLEVDFDEVDWTTLQAQWEGKAFGFFECADGEEDEVAKAAEAAVKALGFPTVVYELDPQNYKMEPEEVVQLFTNDVRPNLAHTDRIALHEAFATHVDSLQKRGLITEWQAENIDNPFSVPMG